MAAPCLVLDVIRVVCSSDYGVGDTAIFIVMNKVSVLMIPYCAQTTTSGRTSHVE